MGLWEEADPVAVLGAAASLQELLMTLAAAEAAVRLPRPKVPMAQGSG